MSTVRYLLVEQPGPWPAEGLGWVDVPSDVRDQLTARAGELDATVLLIRRPLRHQSPVCLLRSWCAVDTDAPAGQRVRWGAWSYPTDLLAGLDRLADLAAAERAADLGHPGPDDPVLLVGTTAPASTYADGPTAYAISRRWPEATWESTHRAGLLLLPSGATYDTVTPELVTLLG